MSCHLRFSASSSISRLPLCKPLCPSVVCPSLLGLILICSESVLIRLKKKSMSQSLWQIRKPDLKCSFFNVVFFFFFSWAADVSNLSRSQLCSVWNMELDLWMNKIRGRTQSWRRSLLFKVFYCVCHVFSSIFWQASS